jgi:uncharacterized membrane protein YidH (DUF202 family)
VKSDLSVKLFFGSLALLRAIHFGYGWFSTGVEPLILAKRAIGAFIFVVVLLLIAYRSIRWERVFTDSTRFPDGKHPRPRLQIIVVYTFVLLVANAVGNHTP